MQILIDISKLLKCKPSEVLDKTLKLKSEVDALREDVKTTRKQLNEKL